MERRVLGGLLVGGGSRRMGRDKAVLVVGGESMAGRVARALAVGVEEVVLLGVGPVPEELAALRRLGDAALGTGAAASAAAGRGSRGEGRQGPLAGIVAALRAERDAAWVIASCDLPRATPEAVRWLLRQRRQGTAVVLPRIAPGKALRPNRAGAASPDGPSRPRTVSAQHPEPAQDAGSVQPLLAVYEPAALPLLEALVAEGRRGPRHLAGRPGVATPTVPADLAPAWTDADTPADLGDLEATRLAD